MKQNGTLSNIHLNDQNKLSKISVEVDSLFEDEIGDNHVMTSIDTPLRNDAFDMSDEAKINIIEKQFKVIMETLGLDLTDDSLKGTPKRVAKMYVKEIFQGLNPKNFPDVALFENKYQYKEMLVEKNISFYSNCEHHFVPIIGKAHLAYVSKGKVIGLSKLNRIVQYYAKRPQVQERMTIQIGKKLQEVLETDDIAVIMNAKHLCVSSRGIKDDTSETVTSFFGGVFENGDKKTEFMKYLEMD